jgi:GTP cyclohydrolase II
MDYLKRFIGSKATFPSRAWGLLTVESASFTPATDGDLIVIVGNPFGQPQPLVRIHSECVFSEVFQSELCDCAEQLHLAMGRLTQEGHGLLFYLRFDGRGEGLAAKVQATALEVSGIDTYESRLRIGVHPDSRRYSAIGAYLVERGVHSVRLLTNNPRKAQDVEDAGLAVATEPLYVSDPNAHVRKLYRSKSKRFMHSLPDDVT